MKNIKLSIRYQWPFALLFLLSIGCYISVLIPPTIFWPAVFTSYAIPILMILNVLVLLAVFFVKRILIIFPVLSLLCGAIFIMVTISVSRDSERQNKDVSVLSYNVRFFRDSGAYDSFSEELIAWVSNDTSAIKCIQEYCNSNSKPSLNSTKIIEQNGYESFSFAAEGSTSEHDQGLAIFSKYEILDTGFVWKNYGSFNAGIYVDIKIGSDILRIYNVHLESMALSTRSFKNTKQYDTKVKKLLTKLKVGAQKRAVQIQKLIEHCNSSPYPYIICGDFNDTPYSYNYFKLKRRFLNSFEEAGNGFGFSFNSLLFFLRIDHQFYQSGIEAVDYRVDRSIKISDHFPTRGVYRMK